MSEHQDQLIDEELQFQMEKLGHVVRNDTLGMANDDHLAFFAYSYSRAFEVLFEEAAKRPDRTVLMHPLLLLCRHSIELSIKHGLEQLGFYDAAADTKITHSLEGLWQRLLNALRAADFQVDDEYTALCTEVVMLLHNHDMRGDRFRYPANTVGATVPSTIVDLDRLRLERVVRDRNAAQKHVWRASIILLSAAGVGTAAIMRRTGKREAEEGTVAVRTLGEKEQRVMPLAEAIAMLKDEATPPDLR